MADPPERYSPSIEDYLKVVFTLTERGEAASTNSIAERLAVAPSSVTGMIKRLAEGGLLEHVPYRGVRLTDSGSREALRIVRRHRVIESYLTERLGYAWDDVHDEAERLEHAASDRLVEAMAHALDHPRHDPHGAPIPTAAGEMEPPPVATLAEAEGGAAVLIRAVQDEDSDRLRALEESGLKPGVCVRVEQRATANGPLTVRVGGEGGPRRMVSVDLARLVFVSEPE
jgi:DtxR family transcriptional regulator, Mn-dependent transcriptional regulator